MENIKEYIKEHHFFNKIQEKKERFDILTSDNKIIGTYEYPKSSHEMQQTIYKIDKDIEEYNKKLEEEHSENIDMGWSW